MKKRIQRVKIDGQIMTGAKYKALQDQIATNKADKKRKKLLEKPAKPAKAPKPGKQGRKPKKQKVQEDNSVASRSKSDRNKKKQLPAEFVDLPATDQEPFQLLEYNKEQNKLVAAPDARRLVIQVQELEDDAQSEDSDGDAEPWAESEDDASEDEYGSD